MNIGDIIFGRLWLYDNDVLYFDRTNTYMFIKNSIQILLQPDLPAPNETPILFGSRRIIEERSTIKMNDYLSHNLIFDEPYRILEYVDLNSPSKIYKIKEGRSKLALKSRRGIKFSS